jgi:uncharacterized protein (DUF1778 family)
LTQAARLKNQSVSQFLLQLALPVAEEIVKTHIQEAGAQETALKLQAGAEVQTVFPLNAQAWEEFQWLLDAPPRELPELKKLLRSKPVWES